MIATLSRTLSSEPKAEDRLSFRSTMAAPVAEGRGMVNGIVLGLALWAAILTIVCFIWRAA